ncbi:MAG TPA: WYL domain-containing protein [Aquihabitans sp.]|nr:WYL domain-containing protein [Aquihabitans sp.]
MSGPRITAAGRVQRLLAVLQWAARHPDGVPVDELCQRFRLKQAELARELELASMIGADATHYDEMPFEVFIEDGLVFVRLFAFRRPLRLTPAEGLALVAAADVLVDRADDPGLAGPLQRALAKLAALLGIEPGQAVDVDLDPDGGEVGRQLVRAAADDRRVAFTYWTYGRDAVARREVDPWVLFPDRGTWYLAGWAHDPGAPRHFRIDRIEDLEVLDAPRTQPPPKDLEASLGVGHDAPQVVLDLAPNARWVAEAHPILEAEELADGWTRATLAVTATPWLERLLLRLGPDARVVAIDPELGSTDLVAAAAARVLARYRG